MINYSKVVKEFGLYRDLDDFEFSPFGFIRQTLGLYGKSYVSPVESRFSNDSSVNKSKVTSLILRDGALPLAHFFMSNKPSKQKVGVFKDLQFLIPPEWKESVFLYDFLPLGFHQDHRSNVVVFFNANQLICPEKLFDQELQRVMVALEKFKRVNKYLVFFNSQGLNGVNSITYSIQCHEKFKKSLGKDLKVIDFEELLYGFDLKTFYFYIFNSLEVLSDPYIFHAFASKGACPLFPKSKDRPEKSFPLSLYHELAFFKLGKAAGKKEDLETRSRAWQELLDRFSIYLN